MPATARIGDICDGQHPIPSPYYPWPKIPTPCIEGSPNVYANSLNVSRVGDAWQSHNPPPNQYGHPRFLATGAPSVFINGQQAGRIGDDLSCFSKVAMGSSNVFIGNS